MSWKDQYRVVGIVPGKVITRQCGEIDFSSDKIPVEIIEKLYKSGCRYLKPIRKKQTLKQKTESPA
jgi:hypothetical protein